MKINSSAVPSETSKGGVAMPPSLLRCFLKAKTFEHDARSFRHDAAILYYSPVRKFQFPLNQDIPYQSTLRYGPEFSFTLFGK